MSSLIDYGIPLSYLKSNRRILIEKLAEQNSEPSIQQLQEIATVHVAIAAAEAVIAEMDAE